MLVLGSETKQNGLQILELRVRRTIMWDSIAKGIIKIGLEIVDEIDEIIVMDDHEAGVKDGMKSVLNKLMPKFVGDAAWTKARDEHRAARRTSKVSV